MIDCLIHCWFTFRSGGCKLGSGKPNYECPDKCSCYTSIHATSEVQTDDNTVLFIDCSNQMLTHIPSNISPDVTFLRLDGNYIKSLLHMGISLWAFSTRALFLNSSNIEKISSEFFNSFPDLLHVYLHDNMIRELPGQFFETIPSLHLVTLHENQLQTLDLEDINNHTENLQLVTLAQNPWNCDCEFGKPFEKWIHINSKIVDDETDIRCGTIQPNLPINSTSDDTLTNYTVNFYPVNQTNISQIQGINVSQQNNFNNDDSHADTVSLYKGKISKVNFDHCVPNKTVEIEVPNPLNHQLIVVFSTLGSVFMVFVALGIILFYYRMLILVWCYNNPTTNCFFTPKLKDEVSNQLFIHELKYQRIIKQWIFLLSVFSYESVMDKLSSLKNYNSQVMAKLEFYLCNVIPYIPYSEKPRLFQVTCKMRL